jgi:hypothetical protein
MSAAVPAFYGRKRSWSASRPAATMVGSKREAYMRIKPDGTLDEIWRARPLPPRPPAKTPEQLRADLIEALLFLDPTLSRAEAEKHTDAYM